MNAILARVGPPIRAIRGVVGNPSLRRAEIAFTFFNTAEIATWIAILVYAHDRGGASEVGVVGMLLILPASVIAPIAGTFGDRIRRERVVRLGYAAQAATAAATGIAMATRAPAAIV